MVEAVSPNMILASAFGSAPARRIFAGNLTAAGQPNPASSPTPTEAYPQPVDTIEISTPFLGEQAEMPQSDKTGQTAKAIGTAELSEEEQAEVRKLKQRDQEVRRHEQAHKASAGQHASGGPSFEYTTGPDGKRYAVGGEVSIDTSEVSGDPQATIAKMQQIQRAANAPANPSSQDRAVAAQAAAAERAARAELAEQRSEQVSGSGADGAGSSPTTEAGKSDQVFRPNNPSGSSTETTGALVDLIA